MLQRPAAADVPGALPFATSSCGIVLHNRRHSMNDQDTQRAVGILNKIMEHELAGVVRYMHYSLMIYGYNRIPIVSWFKSNADESLAHAHKAGELVTLLG